MAVCKAVQNVNERIAPALVGMDVTKQKEIDKVMDPSLVLHIIRMGTC